LLALDGKLNGTHQETAIDVVLYQVILRAGMNLIGGGIGFSTAWIYARRAFAAGGEDPRELVKAHYRAEALKLAFTVVLFAAAVVLYEEVSTLPLLLTYIATLAVYWVALLFA